MTLSRMGMKRTRIKFIKKMRDRDFQTQLRIELEIDPHHTHSDKCFRYTALVEVRVRMSPLAVALLLMPPNTSVTLGLITLRH